MRVEVHAHDVIGVARKGADQLGRRRIPQLHRVIIGASRKRGAVWRPGDIRNSLKGKEAIETRESQHNKPSSSACRKDQRAVWQRRNQKEAEEVNVIKNCKETDRQIKDKGEQRKISGSTEGQGLFESTGSDRSPRIEINIREINHNNIFERIQGKSEGGQ